jgi:hypothetical protein
LVPIYDGTNMVPTVFAEISQATTDSTKSPAAVAASKYYDLFVWNDSGTVRCTRGPAWTNSTTRGYTLTVVSGISLNTSSITNGPAASRGTWVGTITSNGSSTIDYIFGAAASGGTAAFFGVWNAYNRVPTPTTVTDNGVFYNAYTSATPRQARASAGNQISYVMGAAEDGVIVSISARMTTTNVSGSLGDVGIGVNTTSAFSFMPCRGYAATATNYILNGSQTVHVAPALGLTVISRNEAADGTNAMGFNQVNGDYLSATIWN